MARVIKSSLSVADIGRLRLAHHAIAERSCTSPVEAVRHMLAMQGQDFSSAKWSIGVRTPGATEAGVEAAFANGTIVRSWPMRGTLHVTLAEDLLWMLDLLAPRMIQSGASRRKELELDEATLVRAGEIAQRELEVERCLTREEILAAIEQSGISIAGQRGYHILFHLSVTKLLCIGPPHKKAQTFVLFRDWVKGSRPRERDEALEEIARRYFFSHGPATMADFVGWTKLTTADAKKAIALAAEYLTEFEIGDAKYFIPRNAEDSWAAARAKVMGTAVVLSGFDEYVLGYKERASVISAGDFAKVVPGNNGVFMPTIVIDGQVRGIWRRTLKAKAASVELMPFAPLSKSEHASVLKAIHEWAAFVGKPAQITSR